MDFIKTVIKIILIVIVTIIFASLAIIASLLDRSGKVYHFLGRIWAKLLLWIAGVKVETIGLENINSNENYVYVANHCSGFDIPVVMASVPGQLRIVFKKELTKIPLFGWQLRIGPYILIDRENPTKAMESLEIAKKKIEKGASVLLFAEGTRSQDGNIQPFKRGAFTLATRSGRKIVPLTIKGTFEILPKKKFRIRPGIVKLFIDPPIEHDGSIDKKSELELMEKVRNIIVKNYYS
ncbi:MAG: 1-acyl-sn-glycerol-3-phosphate acyltransferase [Ignavibacteria bacterium]|jgi:1-acyl-sn-glycerol-3-phosphate acyltransferase|nr:1-acyl-sn-glycerol-3-phosphate acyltransferase [Ignavibacteria bacterium]MDH7528570.1 lysophospholipid acyltransferase family protein [Ignavibacteria bacterium]